MERSIRDIVAEVIDIERAMDAEKKRHDAACEKLSMRLGEIRRTCKHQGTKRHPDPSGNNGSWDECEICGAEV